jgi:SAM-dependent methyltransferase
MILATENKLMRRVAGYHDIRMDGMTDLVMRARDASVLDLGCNRGLVGFEFANNGASLVHGCDIDPECITVARHLFADLRSVKSQFEVVDLSKGISSLKVFGDQKYDITLMLATYHKLKRLMSEKALNDLMKEIAARTNKFFAWRATSDKQDENEQEKRRLDRDLEACGFRRIHTSLISLQLGLAAIWVRR